MQQLCVSSAQSVGSVFSFSFPLQLLFFVLFTRFGLCVCSKCGVFVVCVVVVVSIAPSIKGRGRQVFVYPLEVRGKRTLFYFFDLVYEHSKKLAPVVFFYLICLTPFWPSFPFSLLLASSGSLPFFVWFLWVQWCIHCGSEGERPLVV